MNLDVDQLAAGTGASLQRAALWIDPMRAAMGIFEITELARIAAYLAQVGHESGRLGDRLPGGRIVEIWGPTPAQAGYEGRKDLGNTQPGDGKRFLGRGPIQITGRANYARVRDRLRKFLGEMVPDFEASPELLENPRWGAYASALFWYDHGLNALADTGDFMTITRRINGGTNGYDDRLALWERGKAALGVA